MIARLPSPGSADILSDNAPLFFATNPDTDAKLAFDLLNSGIQGPIGIAPGDLFYERMDEPFEPAGPWMSGFMFISAKT